MTIYDVATALKVSPATVSMALNNNKKVAQKTRDRVMEYATKNGFKRNEQARNFRLKRSNMIAVVVYNIDNAFWSGVVKAIENKMGKGYSVILCNSDGEFEKEKKILKTLKQRQIDGIIIQPATLDDSFLIKLQNHGIPVVLFERTESNMLSFVKGNDYKAALRLTTECIEAGHAKLAFLSFRTNSIGVEDRIKGFRQACSQAGIENNCELFIAEDISLKAVCEVFIHHVRRFSAVICSDDRIACLLLKALASFGIKVPDDISVTGWNNSKFLEYISPSLTSVCIPVEAMGRNAAKIITTYLNGDKKLTQQYIKEEIFYRESFRKLNSNSSQEKKANFLETV